MNTSTLAGEYVTAQDHVGNTEVWSNFETRTSCRRGVLDEGKAARLMRGSITHGVLRSGTWLRILGSFSGPSNFSSLILSTLVVVVAVYVPGQAGQMSNRARGKLSEAKTQRRPHSARERLR